MYRRLRLLPVMLVTVGLLPIAPIGCSEEPHTPRPADRQRQTEDEQPQDLHHEALVETIRQHVYHPELFDPKQPERFIGHVRGLDREPTHQEQVDLGLAYFLSGEWKRAAATFGGANPGLDPQRDRKLKGRILYYQARALAMREDVDEAGWREAALLANQANQLLPENTAIAASRYVMWTKAGDDLEAAAAGTRLKQMNMELEGIEVIDPASAVVAVAIVTTGAVTLYAIHKDKLDSDEIMNITAAMLSAAMMLKASPAVVAGFSSSV